MLIGSPDIVDKKLTGQNQQLNLPDVDHNSGSTALISAIMIALAIIC
jgi:hypothetical protein